MLITPIGSAVANTNFVTVGSSNGEFFSFYYLFDTPPYANSRLAYVREKFGDRQYSARWYPIYPTHMDTHLIRLSDFAGIDREIQIRAERVADYRIDAYLIDPAQVTPTTPGLMGEYFSDTTTTNKVLQRIDSLIDFDWLGGSPDISVPSDNFSARWRGYIQFPATGVYSLRFNGRGSASISIHDNYSSNTAGAVAGTKSFANYNATSLEPLEFEFTYVDIGGNASCRLQYLNSASQWVAVPTSWYLS